MDRHRVIGRPTLYLVLDVFSHMTVGFHVTLENAAADTRFFVPMSKHVSLEQDLSAMIRGGYLGRNPVVAGYLARLHRWVEAVRRGQPDPMMTFRATAGSGAIVSVSGGGKSYSVERVLTLTPQFIQHGEYRGRPFTHRQLVWVKLECPANGSLHSLCQAFFAYVNALCDTPYEERYADPRRSAEQMMPDMARVAGLHSLGLLVIDEIQNLSEAASGGARVMLKFFTELINKLGVPILLVGTPASRKILDKRFRSARRSCGGHASGMWRPMRADSKDWERFLKRLWAYEYVRHHTDLTPSLSRTMHAETQGITDFVVKLYVVAQIRAMTTGIERITEASDARRRHACTRHGFVSAQEARRPAVPRPLGVGSADAFRRRLAELAAAVLHLGTGFRLEPRALHEAYTQAAVARGLVSPAGGGTRREPSVRPWRRTVRRGSCAPTAWWAIGPSACCARPGPPSPLSITWFSWTCWGCPWRRWPRAAVASSPRLADSSGPVPGPAITRSAPAPGWPSSPPSASNAVASAGWPSASSVVPTAVSPTRADPPAGPDRLPPSCVTAAPAGGKPWPGSGRTRTSVCAPSPARCTRTR